MSSVNEMAQIIVGTSPAHGIGRKQGGIFVQKKRIIKSIFHIICDDYKDGRISKQATITQSLEGCVLLQIRLICQ